jgi:hypothetical protein
VLLLRACLLCDVCAWLPPWTPFPSQQTP